MAIVESKPNIEEGETEIVKVNKGKWGTETYDLQILLISAVVCTN